MSAPIILPQWGMGMNDGEVVKWLKAVGDPVAKGDQLVEIESSKVNAEVEATTDGTLGRIDVEEDAEKTVVSIGDTGIGMTEDQVDHVFDEFYKADPSRHDRASELHRWSLRRCQPRRGHHRSGH